MTLMELLTYIGLLAIIMAGSVFSVYSVLFSVEKSNQQTMQVNAQNI